MSSLIGRVGVLLAAVFFVGCGQTATISDQRPLADSSPAVQEQLALDGSGAKKCAHPICSPGSRLRASCDPCVAKVCAVDWYCCKTGWDNQCLREVSSICGQTCGGACTGCVDSSGACQAGTSTSACGVSGAACVACASGQTCQNGTCITGCAPSCSGRQCGSDGCGGSCGTCKSGQTCDPSGTCVSSCVPSCGGKHCGSDGCGGSCGTCKNGQTCDPSGNCISSCVPSCSGKSCGSDGCGGSCGTCAAGQTCDATGTCVSTCTPSCSGKVCGNDGCGGSCGTCAAGQTCSATGTCVSTCTPNCSGKVCGNDGCGGSCGSCAAGQSCDATGQCTTGAVCLGNGPALEAACVQKGGWGNGLSAQFGRIDGTLIAIATPGSAQCDQSNATHLVIEVSSNGSSYPLVVNVKDSSSSTGVFFAEKDAPLVGVPWQQGWHTDSAEKLDYVTHLNEHSTAFTSLNETDLVNAIVCELAPGDTVSVYALGWGNNGAHDVHRNTGGGGADGALVLHANTANPHYMMFHFVNQSF